MVFNLHIAIKAQNGEIYEQLGKTESPTLLPSLYDELATKLGAELDSAGTSAGEGNEPKVTLIREDITYYDSLEQFGESLQFLEQQHHNSMA